MSVQASQRPEIPDHEVMRVIGRGAYGEIWLARSVTGALRAVKVISRATFASERSFQREFEGMSAFEPISRAHEGFVDILHVGRGEGFFYYIMELADDLQAGPAIEEHHYRPKTLKSMLEAGGRLPARDCIEVALQLTEALDALHSRGLTHRDIKPSNIIFSHGLPKLADIGLVAMAGQESFVGTEGYVPPEGPGTPQADIFSLGKVLYEMAMGKDRLEFPEMPTQLGELNDKAHILQLNEILLKACAGKTRRRYPSAAEMRKDLLLLKGERRRRVLVPLLAVGVLALALAAVVAAQQIHRPPLSIPAVPARPGSVAFTTQPAGAMVFLDDRVQHSPGIFQNVLPGSHRLRVLLADYEPVEQTIAVPDGRRLALPEISLTHSVGALSVASESEGATFVLRSGTAVVREGRAPALLAGLPVGSYELSGAAGNRQASETVEINRGGTNAVTLSFPSGNGSLKVTSAPGGATVLSGGREIGHTPLFLEEVPPGNAGFTLRLAGYKDASVSGLVEAQRCTFLAARLERSASPQPGKSWTNSLGMVFVPVGNIRISQWETRVRDYAAFCAATGRPVPQPDFAQTPDDPVVLVSWFDATDFCAWLTRKEREENLLAPNQSYRLPTDPEWSAAAGLPPEGGASPEARDGKLRGHYPWGSAWPPPGGAGNYADSSLAGEKKSSPAIAGYSDGWPQTAPVGRFTPGATGLYDLGGNVWEWCREGYKGDGGEHDWGVLRGGSWANAKKSEIELSYRNVVDRSDRDVIYGFRCVLAEDDSADSR